MTTSLARSTLRYEWRRFLPAVLSVAFSGTLMLVQLGLLLGMFATVTVLVDRSGANLWITSPEVQSFDQARDIPLALRALVRLHPDVRAVDTMTIRDADWKAGTRTRVTVTLVALAPNGSSLACPSPLRAALCLALAQPGGVVVDRSERSRLGTDAGRWAELNGHRVHVVGIGEGLRSIGNTYVFCSEQTARQLAAETPAAEDLVSVLLLRAEPEAALERVRTELQTLLRRSAYRVWTGAELSMQSQRWWLTESGVGAGFLYSSLLGLIVGVLITQQTLRGAILGYVREYATFRAIGVSAFRLGTVVLEQSFWIGLAGSLLTLVGAGVALSVAQAFDVPLKLTATSVLAALVVALFTAIVSGLLATRELYRLEPAELLR